MINHCNRRITQLSDIDVSFGLFNLFTYFDAFWVIVSNTQNAKKNLKIYLIEQKIYPFHHDECYMESITVIYHATYL